MLPAPMPLTWGPDSPFKYIAGDAALDLVNTAAWTERGLQNDRLTDYGRLTRWAAEAGIVSGPDARRLRRIAAVRPADAAAAWEASRALRSALQRLFEAVATGSPLDDPLRRFHPFFAETYAQLRLSASGLADRAQGRALRWAWQDQEERLDSVLWPVVRSAAELLASDEAARIRICGGPDCGWMYVDRSRNGLRRWCEMETCGTRAKSRRRVARGRPAA